MVASKLCAPLYLQNLEGNVAEYAHFLAWLFVILCLFFLLMFTIQKNIQFRAAACYNMLVAGGEKNFKPSQQVNPSSLNNKEIKSNVKNMKKIKEQNR